MLVSASNKARAMPLNGSPWQWKHINNVSTTAASHSLIVSLHCAGKDAQHCIPNPVLVCLCSPFVLVCLCCFQVSEFCWGAQKSLGSEDVYLPIACVLANRFSSSRGIQFPKSFFLPEASQSACCEEDPPSRAMSVLESVRGTSCSWYPGEKRPWNRRWFAVSP